MLKAIVIIALLIVGGKYLCELGMQKAIDSVITYNLPTK